MGSPTMSMMSAAAAAEAKEKTMMVAENDILTPEQRQHREEQLEKIERMKAQFCLSDSAMQQSMNPNPTMMSMPPNSMAQCAPPPGYPCSPGGVQMIRGPRGPGMIMMAPGECMPGQVMMLAGPQGPQMQVAGVPGHPQPGFVSMENPSMNPNQMTANIEWQKLRQEFEIEQYQKQNQDLLCSAPVPPTPVAPVMNQPTSVPSPVVRATAPKGTRPRQTRPAGMPIPGTRMSLQQQPKPMVMVAPSNVIPPGVPRGIQRMPFGMRGQRMGGPRMMQEQHMAFVTPEEQMMMQQHQQYMMGPGGQHPRARMMMQMQQGSNLPMMAGGQPQPHPEFMMHMDGGGYLVPQEQSFPGEMGFLGDLNRGQCLQDFGPQASMMDPAMVGPPCPEFFSPHGVEFNGGGQQDGMKMQVMNSGLDMDIQGATGPVQQSGQGPPTVNNTYVNATMSIQQLNIQNMGPPISQLSHGSAGATPPLGPAGPSPHLQGFQMRPNVGPQMGHDGAPNCGDFGMPPFAFQNMPEPLTNLDSKVPSQKLQYFPASKPSAAHVQANPSMPVSTPQGVVPPPNSIGYQGQQTAASGNQLNTMDNFSSGVFDDGPNGPSQNAVGPMPFGLGQDAVTPVSQAQYGSFENFQQQLYASTPSNGSKQ